MEVAVEKGAKCGSGEFVTLVEKMRMVSVKKMAERRAISLTDYLHLTNHPWYRVLGLCMSATALTMSSEENDADNGMKETTCDFIPKTTSAYGDPHYWDERFSAEEHYEWLKDYSHFQHLIRPYICQTHSILELGCGNSRLSQELHAEGVTDITCIDLSAVAVQRMKKRLKEQGYPGIQVIEADMLDLPFKSESFDIVIEKGTMDVLYVDSGDPWNPRPEMVSKVMKMLKCVHKILKPDGIFISISFGQPHFRRQLFEAPCFTWSVEWKTFGEGFYYFFYTLMKGRRSSFDDDRKECSRGRVEEAAGSLPAVSMFHHELDSEDFIFRTTL